MRTTETRVLLCFIYFFSIFSFISNAQTTEKTDPYQAEAEGYFVHPVNTIKGIVISDNHASKLYLIKNNNLVELIATPGCGRYYTVSPDKSVIGFKLIKPDGMQVPALYKLTTMKIIELSAPVDLCGQVSFSNNGKIAYTIGNNLVVTSNGNTETFYLGTYSNGSPISPDGNYALFNNENDQLFIIDLTSGQIIQFTDNTQGYMYPQWSPDGSKIAFSTLSGTLKVLNLATDSTYTIGKGENAVWSENSQDLFFDFVLSENFEIKGSEIFVAKYDGSSVRQLTNTPETFEMFPFPLSNSTIVYSTYNARQIVSSSLRSNRTGIQNPIVLAQATLPLYITANGSNNFSQKISKAITMVPGDVPYTHQVYDTPTWHSGYWSCAPTTAIMAIAYYNRLPKWPTPVDHGKAWDPHVNNYGSYVADLYRYNEVYYNTTDTDYAGNTSYGGYGYMWGLGSPSSYMDNYFINHDITSVQSYSTTFENVQTEINAGFPYPICSTITAAGHLTLAVGYVIGQHTLIYNDPYGDKNDGTYPNYYGKNAYYDWPGYNNGYENINSMAWTVTAETNQPIYNDTIIDDVYYDHGFYLYNESIAKMRYYRDLQTGGYNGHFWYTYTSAATTLDTCYVMWTPTLSANGNYEVFAYIPNSGTITATTVQYKVFYSGGNSTVVINQATHLGQWVSLGIYPFTTSGQAYVRLGDGAGIQSQVIAFDAMQWVVAGQDNVVPTTITSVTWNWQTQNFTASFTDTDNAGGSGIEKSFYQMLEYNGAEWHANAQNGFFADNFDSYNASVWTVPVGSGTWNVSSGNLIQTDSSVNNTNIYAALNQNLSNRYIYQFNVKLDDATSGTNQHRLGFHFFSDNASLSNRGNSYFIFFRLETSKLEFYKVVNDTFTQTKVVDNVITSFDQWYDIKVIFDRISGKVDVYRDDIMLGTWTDPSPLATVGSYISFRTGHCKAYINELKVFRSRFPSVTVSMGAAATNDIRYQNPDPSTYAAKIESIVNDAAGNLSAIDYYNLNIDWTIPVCNTVNDGPDADINTTTSATTLSANWAASSDPNSGIAKYWYAIGTSPGAADVVGWTDNALNTTVTNSALSLTNGQTYYFSVKTDNGAGLTSICSSNGVMVSVTTDMAENDDEQLISVVPNPFKENTTIYLQITGEQRYKITLTDVLGRQILVSDEIYKEGKHSININADKLKLSKGMYYLEIRNADKVTTKKIIHY